jgi:hypothetical protein
MIISASGIQVKNLNIQVGDIFVCSDRSANDRWLEIVLSVCTKLHEHEHTVPLMKIEYFCPNDCYKGVRFKKPDHHFVWLAYIIRAEKAC